ncbi:hypothetical protein [Bacillus sp. FJAT-45066]|uniref:hypothetical protein n=1 Tax=Bacillus sp. FJAT-45066 TaxID=2011010 RepID=UPI000BB734F5|nr:hypothetical protein [Bacillus sp. FJAT-45066]
MKQILGNLFIFFLCIQVIGCSNTQETTIPHENTFIINFINKSDIEFQGLEVSYNQNDTYRGSVNIENASKKEKVKKGDSISLEFNKNNFMLNEEVEFKVTVLIDTGVNEKITISSPISTMLASLKSIYYLEISGEDKNSLTIK